MKIKLSRVFAAVLAVAMAVQLAVFAAPPSAQESADIITALGISAVQYALVKDGEVILSGASGFASRLTGRQVEADTMFGIGSVSKMFTTAVIMSLVDEGQIDLDQPVTAYVPDFEMADERYTGITVRMLLNHSSGLAGSTMANAALWDDSDPQAHDTLLSDLKTQRLKADPGAYSVYCNDGFSLAEIVAERVSGMSFTSLVSERVTGPLGLTHTKTPQDDFDRDALVRTYSLLDAAREMPNETLNSIGTGGIYSTASELALFGGALFSPDGPISGESAAATTQPEYAGGQWYLADDNIISYGLGWDSVELYPFNQYGITALAKGGDTVQFHSSLVVLPEHGLSAAVVATGGSSEICQTMAAGMLLHMLFDAGEIDSYPAPVETLPPAVAALDIDTAPLEGLYASYNIGYLVSFDEVGTMSLTVPAMGGAPAGEFYYIGGSQWQDASGLVKLFFIEQQGKSYIMQHIESDIYGLGPTVATVYFAQKLDDYTPSQDITDAWTARNYMAYVGVNAKYTSLAYTYSMPAVSVIADEVNPGYMAAYKLDSGSTMVSVVQIPMSAGRDTYDFTISLENGVEYLTYSDSRFMSIAAVPEIYSGPRSICTIQQSGDARWYYFGADLDGKTITVDSTGGGFACYNAQGQAVNHSAATGEFSFTAQAGGYVVFAGEAGTIFSITVN